MIKQDPHIVKGMNRDTSVSRFSSEFVFDARNIRMTAREDGTLLSVTNERGNKEMYLKDTKGNQVFVEGTVIGYNVLGKYLTLFTNDWKTLKGVDRIYRIRRRGHDFECVLLYKGNLNLDTSHPVETLGVYENDDIQKVYWTDGRNQARVINIKADDNTRGKWCDTSFDFVRELRLDETVTVERSVSASGMFASGVIQYAFTYYILYGQESNIFYTTPLQFVSFDTRGASPEEKVGVSFIIRMSGLDTRFDFVRIYSIHRTSVDAVPTVVNVADVAVGDGSVVYEDTGTTGATVDPTELLYIGGESIVPKTMTSKDNTLFLGNIRLNNKTVGSDIAGAVRSLSKTSLEFREIPSGVPSSSDDIAGLKGYYPYTNTLRYGGSRRFKYLEWYRFGLQFQNKTGKWSEAVYAGDFYNTVSSDTQSKSVGASLTLTSDIVSKAVARGFVRVRGMVVYPSYTDREVVAQGILCPTVFNLEDRFKNSPFSQSSWFTRPDLPVGGSTYSSDPIGTRIWNNHNYKFGISTDDIVSFGAWAEFRHNHPIPDNWKRNAEIQCLANVPESPVVDTSDNAGIASWVAAHREYFFVDRSTLTFHSPDIEFDDTLWNMDLSNVKLRIVGAVGYTANASDIDIRTSTVQNDMSRPGFYNEPVGTENFSNLGVKSLVSGMNYIDSVYGFNDEFIVGKIVGLDSVAFMVYPWHRNGSLNNQPSLSGDETVRSAMLSHNRRSNLKYGGITRYMGYDDVWKAYTGDDIHTGISGAVVFSADTQSLVRVKSPENSGVGDISYYGNIDKVVVPSRDDDEYVCRLSPEAPDDYSDMLGKYKLNKLDGYPIVVGLDMTFTDTSYHKYFVSTPIPLWCVGDSSGVQAVKEKRYAYGTDPVSIKYKSAPHAVLAFNYTKSHKQNTLPTIKGSGSLINYDGIEYDGVYLPWDTSCKGVRQDVIDIYKAVPDMPVMIGFSWLAELYRDDINPATRFGGNTPEAIENNLWLPAGEPVSLVGGNGTAKADVTVEYTEGDTFYQRYDCLKTYPYTLEDQNSVTEIVSFLCETRVNIDGRYDRNRGQTSNLYMMPSNFNLYNKVYSQRNSFFTGRTLNYGRLSLDYFPNTVTWTKERQSGAVVDLWTNVTMASTLDLDGDKGEVTSLNTFNNEILCFQRTGLSNILFNSRVQIPVSDGVPIEISNGLKVDGRRYISNTIGCQNKWSIAQTPSGIYFVDNITKGIYHFGGSLVSLSDRLGFKSWIGKHDVLDSWEPVGFENFVTFYDHTNDDVYFVRRSDALVYSGTLGQFTSFMSYGYVPAMFNLENSFYAIQDGRLWENFKGDYNMFFGQYQPYSLTFVSNPDEPYDKVFNNIDMRSDRWTEDRYNNQILVNKSPFDTLEVWNEYQKGITGLTLLNGRPSPLKRKFRIWRANIPRANTVWNGISPNGRDRIRNTWAYIKLSMNKENTDRMEFHDMIVHYFV